MERTIVVKIGGSTLGSQDTTVDDLVSLQQEGIRLVVVHGGGQLISRWLERQGGIPRFIRGLRVTDESSLEVVVAVLTGLVNKRLVASILSRGGRAVGLSGVDGGLLQARVLDPQLGLVGQVVQVNLRPLEVILEQGFIPVVAPVAIHCLDGSLNSGALLNVNADMAAGEIAHALRAERLVFLTDVEGVLDASRRLIPRLTPSQARGLLRSGILSGGMIPKVEACIRAGEGAVVAQIVDGRRPGALRDSVWDKGVGTRIG